MLGALALAGCAGDASRYPSLALREVERRHFVVPAAPAPPAAVVPGGAEMATIAALRASAESASAAFARKQGAAGALVARARGTGPDSPARGAALVALADLTAQRSATFVPLGELDRLAAEAASEYRDTAAIASAQAAVLALLAEQDTALDALWEELRQ
ncbi:MAG: hypothetical protein ACK4IS_07100 [Erythrobacter sp.]